MSAGSAHRPAGMRSRMRGSRWASASSGAVFAVFTYPGATALTLIPPAAHSLASALVRPATACLLAAYAATLMPPWNVRTDATLMILPRPRSHIGAPKSRHSRKSALNDTANTERQSGCSIARAGPRRMMPALLTRMSTGPSVSTRSAASRRALQSPRSAQTVRTFPPRSDTSRATASRLSRRPHSTRYARTARSDQPTRSRQLLGRHLVHVGERLVLPAHRPDEGVVGRPGAEMHRPWRAEDRLPVRHDDRAGGVGPTAQVHHPLPRPEPEVQVHLGAPVVGVARHGVPDAALGELGNTEHQLAGADAVGVDVLADRPYVRVRRVAQPHRLHAVALRERGRVRGVCRRGDEVEPGVGALERNLSGAGADVEHVMAGHLVVHRVDGDRARAGQAHHRELAPVAETLGAQLFRYREGQHRADRGGSTDDHPVVVAEHQTHLAGHEQVLHEEPLAQPRRRQRGHLGGMRGMADLHGAS